MERGDQPSDWGSSYDAWAPPSASGHAGAPADNDELLPGYDQAREISRGTDSVVYRARHRALTRPVAIKVLLVDDPATVARFDRELELTVRLGHQHPHIVTVLDSGVTDSGQPCIVMEFIERGSLGDQLKASGPLPSADVLRIGRTMADALAFAHAEGVLHRDVKPQNILVLPTSWVLADFGISRLADSDSTASVEHFSYRHAAPQVLDGQPPTPADDIWSLGSTLFTLLDGRPPFASDDPADDTALAYLRRVRTEQPRKLDLPDAPASLVATIERCLTKDPARRWPSAAALLESLQQAENDAQGWAPAAGDTPTPALAAAESDDAPSASGSADRSVPVERIDDLDVVSQVDDLPHVAATATPTATPASPASAPALTPARAARKATAATSPAPAAGPDALTRRPSPAASALSHARAGTPADDAPTGRLESAGAEAPAEPAAPPRRGLSKGLVGAGLLLGSGLGIAVALMTSNGGDGGPRPTNTPNNAVPSVSLPSSVTPSPEVPVSVPSLAPLIVDIKGQGSSVALEWSDPSNGAATFVVIEPGADPRVLAQYPPGTTKGTIDGVDPAAAEVCFTVGAIMGTERGVSPERCVDPSP